ncbi:MAG TPA: hypothetical protein VM032_02050 [Vicinamibacterales bacterium]|nr:hypothetical protein [Vicinamibacterales bacterium]
MKTPMRHTVIVLCFLLPVSARGLPKYPGIEQMPAALEERFALSALPPALRSVATVYRLDVKQGYVLAHRGTGGVTCLVQRTAWEQADFRDDIYVPRCYDAAGSATYLKVLIDAEVLRIRGMAPPALKVEIERRYAAKRYRAPEKAGLSYMLSPVMRTWLPDRTVRTMSVPHVMFYAPGVTDKDIGALPNLSQGYPFIVREGISAQSFMLQSVGKAEAAAIVAAERALLQELCTYRAVLCLAQHATVVQPS